MLDTNSRGASAGGVIVDFAGVRAAKSAAATPPAFRVSRDMFGRLTWFSEGEKIPRSHTGIRPATTAEAILMQRQADAFAVGVLPTHREIAVLFAVMEGVLDA